MSRAADSNSSNGHLVQAISTLFPFPEALEKLAFISNDAREPKGMSSIPTDILDAPKEYVFYMDLPGLSKSDIQVTVEEENTLVIRSGGKRKREDGEEEGCKYLRLERKAPQKMVRKFRLPENADTSAVSAKCESGVLVVVVGKLPPPPKPKTVQVAVA
ncbi:17.4 kDa class III heat shock protein [Cucurbita pepo subsp. pepo]|uniref:17.4 kDa class III heat shock protein n=1 Tax=Cucurbita pepo subsp. pepo TaxID=3664 RepID=UPI000C9D4388|nr:17.4 kDa class III heat shock protein [Cucurbita pepo subsp. pepo]